MSCRSSSIQHMRAMATTGYRGWQNNSLAVVWHELYVSIHPADESHGNHWVQGLATQQFSWYLACAVGLHPSSRSEPWRPLETRAGNTTEDREIKEGCHCSQVGLYLRLSAPACSKENDDDDLANHTPVHIMIMISKEFSTVSWVRSSPTCRGVHQVSHLRKPETSLLLCHSPVGYFWHIYYC